MQIDPQVIAHEELYRQMVRLVTPRPIAWVSTVSNTGLTNLAPFSYFNAVGSKPPTLMFCPANRPDGQKKDTLANIEQTGEFVVNLVSFDLAEKMNQTSAGYDRETSEFEACGLTPAPSLQVRPPRVAESRAQFECRLHSITHLATGPGAANVVIGHILLIHVADEMFDERGRVDPARIDTIGRMGGMSYARTTDRFEIDRPRL